jgi:uncharacterized protein YbaP (TraB family)
MVSRWWAWARVVGFVATTLIVPGCAKKAEAEVPAAQAQVERPLTLWQVSKPGLEPSYLFGTCHMGVSLPEALSAEGYALVTGANLFVMEVDPGSMFRPEVMERMRLPEGQTISGLIGEQDWQRLVEEFGLHDKAAILNQLHPFSVISEVGGKIVARSGAQYSRSAGMMDLALSSLALNAGRQQAWLETIDSQLDVLLGQPMEEYAEQLRAMLDPSTHEAYVHELTAVLDMCRTGDETEALKVMALQDRDFMHALMTLRNRAWIPVIEEYFQRGKVFVAAGAGHMVGEDSVVELLQARGYTVRRLRGTTAAAPPPSDDGSGGMQMARTEFLTLMAAQLPTLLCTEAQPFLRCFQLESTTCAASFANYVHRCGADLDLPEVVRTEDGATLGAKIGECTMGYLLNDFGDQVLDDPLCKVLVGAQ